MERSCDVSGTRKKHHPDIHIYHQMGHRPTPYSDPRTHMRYANTEVFKVIRSLPNEYVQSYIALRNAAFALK
ncbi:YL1 nuclear [Artemisia annua]|uniref:YL1 nuclear n=1 Tax=Artemisia annua TaxID=35608 RepID=A0A2U1L5H9_ARTAN|nr:YL1 nuclear [Artemisia annua]